MRRVRRWWTLAGITAGLLAQTASEATDVFLWSNGTMTDPGIFGQDAVAESINDHGVIVDQSSLGAWIWSGGVFQNLNNLIPVVLGSVSPTPTR